MEHSRPGDFFFLFSRPCWVSGLSKHPMSTNFWHHLIIIVISGRLPVMWIVLVHNLMCGMKQVLHFFRQNTNQSAAEHICAEIAKETWQPNNSSWWCKTWLCWSFWKCPISSLYCWLHRALNQSLSNWHWEAWVCLCILAWIRSALLKQILWPSPLFTLLFMLRNCLEYMNWNSFWIKVKQNMCSKTTSDTLQLEIELSLWG